MFITPQVTTMGNKKCGNLEVLIEEATPVKLEQDCPVVKIVVTDAENQFTSATIELIQKLVRSIRRCDCDGEGDFGGPTPLTPPKPPPASEIHSGSTSGKPSQ